MSSQEYEVNTNSGKTIIFEFKLLNSLILEMMFLALSLTCPILPLMLQEETFI